MNYIKKKATIFNRIEKSDIKSVLIGIVILCLTKEILVNIRLAKVVGVALFLFVFIILFKNDENTWEGWGR